MSETNNPDTKTVDEKIADIEASIKADNKAGTKADNKSNTNTPDINPGSGKKNRLKNFVKKVAAALAEVFKDYPVTMVMILVAALMAAILIMLDYQDTNEETVEKIMVFCFLTAAQAVAVEEVFRKKLIPRIGCLAAALFISGLSVYILTCESDTLFGLDIEMVGEMWGRTWIVYGICLFATVIFFMQKRLKEDIEDYATRSFLALLRSYVLYGLFAGGIAIILLIFNELIFDTDDLLASIEAFLAISFLSAMTIRALSKPHEKPGKFARICVMYALLPMLVISYAIIYIYMIKIFVTNDIPSNSVFPILSWLFFLGTFIWTMAHDIGRDEKGINRAAFIVPYVYIPFIFLQIWSLSIRIGQYGLTVSRYFGIVLIIIEVIYFALYILGRRTKKDMIRIMLAVFTAFSLISVLVPGIRYDDTVIRSQVKRVRKILAKEKIGHYDSESLESAYNTIRRVSFKGEKIADEGFSAQEMARIKECMENNGNHYQRTAYMRDSQRIASLDISEYKRIYETGYVNWEYGDIKEAPYDVHFTTIESEEYDPENTEYVLNLEGLAKEAISQYEEGKEYDFMLGRYGLMKVDDDHDLFIKEVSISYNGDEPEKISIQFSGYLLEK